MDKYSMTRRDTNENETEDESESDKDAESGNENENESLRFDLIKEINVQTCKPGDLRIPIPKEVKKKVADDGDGGLKVHFGWYHKHDVPIISSDSLREDEYTSTDTVKILSNGTIRPPRTDGQIDYISYAESNDCLYWIATEEMLSEGNVSSAYLTSREKLLMLINDPTGNISNDFATLPNYTIGNTRKESTSDSRISIFNIFTDIFGI